MNKKIKIGCAALASLAAVSMVGCMGGGNPNAIALTIWVSEADRTFAGEVVEAFKQANPDKEYNFTIDVQGENDVATRILNDVENAADVFSYANDQLSKLINGDALTQIAGDRLTRLQQLNAENAMQSAVATVNGTSGTYGMPYTDNTFFLYYNKSVLSETDVQTFDGILAKCTDGKKFAFPMTDGWYTSAFYFGKDDSQRRPYSSLACIILSNPAQANCDGKTFREVSGQDVFFNDIKGEDDYVYTSHSLESVNSCYEGCARCDYEALKSNPTHEGATIVFNDAYGNAFSYISDIYVVTTCPVCQMNDVSEVIEKIFISKGYSVCEMGAEGGVTHKVGINKESLARYEEISGEKLSYGVVAGIKKDGYSDALVSFVDGELTTSENAIAVDFTSTEFEILELKLTNINKSATVYCNAFVSNGSDVSYICDTTVQNVAIPQEIVIAPPTNDEE